MAIYTKTGDQGTTSLFDGTRVKKFDLRVDTYGTFDECCAQISVAQKMANEPQIIQQLDWIQTKLFQLNAEIATKQNVGKLTTKSELIADTDTKKMEEWIDQYTAQLPELHSFILPGQTLSAAQLHVARAVCRRGERLLAEFAENQNIRDELRKFVNRLSDCLYIFARVEDRHKEEKKIVHEVLRRYKEQSRSHTAEISLEASHEIFEICLEQANKMGTAVSIALVDKTGRLTSFYRMPEAILVSDAIAEKKAYSAVAMGTDTHQLQSLTQPQSDLYQLETITEGKIVTFGGGLVIKDIDGKVIGGLGVSGGSVEEDIAIAQKGLEKLKEIYHG